MSFLYPLGLLGLLAIPLLILIYILKNKHTEQVISSTYLWTQSERFLKRRNPISKLTGIVSLILQILTVVLISLALAHPVFTVRGGADDFVFILDASGSMYYEQSGETRFDLAKEEIEDLIKDSADGSAYTLITAGDSTGVLFENVEDKDYALSLLESAKGSATSPAFTDARALAQGYFTQRPASKIYLVTDKSYETLQNVQLINVSSRQRNYGVSDLAYSLEGGDLLVTGKAYSYENAAKLNLVLTVTREEGAVEYEQTLPVEKLTATDFTFTVENKGFHSLKVRILNGDALPLDDETVLYNASGVSYAEESQVLLVGKTEEDTFFLETALEALGVPVEAIAKEDYENEKKSGYQLYVFDTCSPEMLPTDGAVWFVNPQSSVTNAGFSVHGTAPLLEPRAMEYSTSTATRVQELLKDVSGEPIYIGGEVGEYVRCSFQRKFYTILSYAGNPMLSAGTNSHGNREVVFSFDFHKSDFILTPDYMVLMRNLLHFTFPSMVESSTAYCGENITVNVFANSQSIRIDSPSGQIVFLDTGNDLVEYTLTEVGTYKVTQVVEGYTHTAYVYGNLPMEERASLVNDTSFAVSGTPSEERRDGKYDALVVLLIILAAVFVADWVVYSYEQYQLR